ncbi:hypothetical protein IW492_14475 [Enterococcus sp. BWB1-3]|uniref:hypothetical protein n=1 Tax=unclassified Enterococcus TaxID=2608891 RepID=UPI001920546E|nr:MULTISPECIES: hypothetical protein [unclassified Enterococcus]MBL1230436.1 hypothetical protein [Enterococcus sp. BWB1-3]MCB5953360.1 hypothetical protein [Enterococcus sp. BWT-B8]MCB5955726.1 hypothetical protein [Enterococcus sp. CWB-B31]
MKPNIGYYIQVINDIVQETEKVGEEMNGHYEELRQAIDDKKEADISKEKLAEVQGIFNEGTEKYEVFLKQILGLRPPVKVIGIHKKLERCYTEYVAGCKEMVLSLDPEKGLDTALFNASEEKQDKATDDISFCITKMSNLLLKK